MSTRRNVVSLSSCRADDTRCYDGAVLRCNYDGAVLWATEEKLSICALETVSSCCSVNGMNWCFLHLLEDDPESPIASAELNNTASASFSKLCHPEVQSLASSHSSNGLRDMKRPKKSVDFTRNKEALVTKAY